MSGTTKSNRNYNFRLIPYEVDNFSRSVKVKPPHNSPDLTWQAMEGVSANKWAVRLPIKILSSGNKIGRWSSQKMKNIPDTGDLNKVEQPENGTSACRVEL